MRKMMWAFVAVVLLPVVTGAQDKQWKQALENQLKERYPLTKMDNSLFSGRTSTKNEGIVLTIQQAGMPFTDGSGLIARIAEVEDGRLTSRSARSSPGNYIGRVGDQVLVRDISVDDTKVELKLLTLEPIQQTRNGTTSERRYYGLIRYKFVAGWLAQASVDDVVKAISTILASDDQVTASKTIELGQSIAQVEAVLGKPETVVKLGARTIYTYKSMKVIFTDGKVSDVQ